jgi:hypothetical protein
VALRPGDAVAVRFTKWGGGAHWEFPWVTLFLHDRPWAASYYDSVEQPLSVYVDVTTPAVWDARTSRWSTWTSTWS